MKKPSPLIETPPLTIADRRHELEFAQRAIARARLGLYPGMQAGIRSLNAIRDESSRRTDGIDLTSAMSACQLLACGRLPDPGLCIAAVQQLKRALDSGEFSVDETIAHQTMAE